MNPFRRALPLALLLILLAALATLPAVAQGCIADGPEMASGLLYLETHARLDTAHAIDAVASDPLAGKLILNDTENSRTTLQILDVDCNKTAFGTGWQGDTRMWIYCLEGRPCVQDETRSSASDDWTPRGAARTSASYVTETGDSTSTAQLSSTFAHVIYQLQQQLGDMHTASHLPVPTTDQ